MEVPDPLPLRSIEVPREVTQVEGCDCGGMVWHLASCPLLHMPSLEAGRRITVAEAGVRHYTGALNAKLHAVLDMERAR